VLTLTLTLVFSWTQRTLDHIKNMLLVSAREETVSALGGMQQRVKVLQERPESLDGLVPNPNPNPDPNPTAVRRVARTGAAFKP
jgi:hypothetical protein